MHLISEVSANTKINNIILGEITNNKQKITITVLNCNECKIMITKNYSDSEIWYEVLDGKYITYLADGNYKVLVKDTTDTVVSSRNLEVNFNKRSLVREYYGIIIASVLVIIFVLYLFRRKKNTKI